MERYEQAIQDLNCAIELDPTYEWVLVERAEIYFWKECYQEALADLEKAVELDPEDSWTWYNIALAMVLWKGISEAQVQLDTAHKAIQSKLDTKNRGEALYLIGGLAAVTGHHEEALNYLQQAIPLEQQAVIWARHDIAWKDLHSDSRFQSLVNQ